jgi:copper oxidase (laccase) domain-containing protein
VLILDEKGRLSNLAFQPEAAPLKYCDLQPDDQTNIVECEGLFTFTDYLLMAKPGDCFFMLVMANTKRGRCIGMVHAGRKQILRGVSLSWVQPLLNICEQPSDIRVVITPGLQRAHHTIKADYTSEEFGTVHDLQRFFGNYSYPVENGGIAIDSEAYLADALKTAGITNVLTTGIDTYEQQAKGSGCSSRYCRENSIEKTGNICFIHFVKTN